MRIKKRTIGIVIAVCIIVPQVVLYMIQETKSPGFQVVRKEKEPKVYILQKPSGKNGQPSGFNESKIIERKIAIAELKQSVLGQINDTKHHELKQQHVSIQDDGGDNKDDLPLNEPDPFCSETYSTFQTEKYCLPQLSQSQYFTRHGSALCLAEGTKSIVKNFTECICRTSWHGQSCSLPQVLYDSQFPRDKYAALVAPKPRHILNALPISHEFDLLEARMHELGDVVDLFILGESNYTAAGHPKPRLLLNKLNAGYLKEFHHKILYASLGYFPKKGYYSGWVMDALLRNHMGEALKTIQNLEERDIIVLNDADELPKRETLLFLKLHTGYPQPIGFHLIHNMYGFFWRDTDKFSKVHGACTIGMLHHFFNWQLYNLRRTRSEINKNLKALEHFKYKHLGTVEEWSFGNPDVNRGAGWHCSWCFTPHGIRIKLNAAHWSDLPRWGAYPNKTSTSYIASLIKNGIYFDDKKKMIASDVKSSTWYAPKYLQENPDRFKYLLFNQIS